MNSGHHRLAFGSKPLSSSLLFSSLLFPSLAPFPHTGQGLHTHILQAKFSIFFDLRNVYKIKVNFLKLGDLTYNYGFPTPLGKKKMESLELGCSCPSAGARAGGRAGSGLPTPDPTPPPALPGSQLAEGPWACLLTSLCSVVSSVEWQ